MYFAKLVKGKTYDVLGHIFLVDQEQPVEQEVYEYLQDNEFFEVREGEASTNEFSPLKPEGEVYTESELKKLNKSQQEAIIKSLSGDFIEETKNEAERIALILKLQEEGE